MKNKGSFSLFEIGFIAGYKYDFEVKLNNPLTVTGYHKGAYQTAKDQNYDKFEANRSFQSPFFRPNILKSWQQYIQYVANTQPKDERFRLWNEEFDYQSDKAYKEGYRGDNIRLLALKRTNEIFGVNSPKDLEAL